MNIYDELENLKVRARSNPELAQALLATRGMKNPVSAVLHRSMDAPFPLWIWSLPVRILTQQCVAPRMEAARIRRCCREKMICMRCF